MRSREQGSSGVVMTALVSLTVFYLSLSGHMSAGGGVPDPVTLGVLAALTAAIGLAVRGRRFSVPSVFILVLIGELGFHVVLSVTSHHVGGLLPTPQMLANHVVAAVFATMLLSFLSTVIAAWSRFTSSMIGTRPIPVTVIADTRVTQASTTRDAVIENWVLHLQARRGPPAHS